MGHRDLKVGELVMCNLVLVVRHQRGDLCSKIMNVLMGGSHFLE